jgi:hypothetical protein
MRSRRLSQSATQTLTHTSRLPSSSFFRQKKSDSGPSPAEGDTTPQTVDHAEKPQKLNRIQKIAPCNKVLLYGL